MRLGHAVSATLLWVALTLYAIWNSTTVTGNKWFATLFLLAFVVLGIWIWVGLKEEW